MGDVPDDMSFHVCRRLRLLCRDRLKKNRAEGSTGGPGGGGETRVLHLILMTIQVSAVSWRFESRRRNLVYQIGLAWYTARREKTSRGPASDDGEHMALYEKGATYWLVIRSG